MDSTTTEEKFFSAVDIIKSLPKTGSINPSNGTKLKFYSYFKQATEGPCEIPKPGFWEVVNRAKWEAWNKLGNMSKEEAMQNYVQEFVRVLQEHSMEDLDDPSMLNEYAEMIGPFIDFAPKEVQENLKMNGSAKKPLNNNSEDIYSTSKPPVNGYNLNGNNNNNDSDSDEFSDTLERVNEDEPDIDSGSLPTPLVAKGGANAVSVRGGGDHNQGEGSSPNGGPPVGRGSHFPRQPRSSDVPPVGAVGGSSHLLRGAGGGRRGGDDPQGLDGSPEVSEQLAMAVIRLQHVMEQVVVRLDSLEALMLRKNSTPAMVTKMSEKNSSRWSFFGMSPKLAIVILAWPFIAQWLMYIIRKRQRSLS